MSDHQSTRAADPLADRLRQHLSETARRELDDLRAALDSRLLALEAALAHPEPHDSLEVLVLDLARVATTEAEAAAARASLEADLESQKRAATIAELERALDGERSTASSVRADLEAARKKFEGDLSRERATAKKSADQLSAVQSELTETRRALDARSGALQAAHDSARANEESAAARLKSMDAERMQTERQFREASVREQESEQRAHQAAARATDIDNRRQAAEQRAADAESRRQEMEARARELETRLEQANGRVADLEARLAAATTQAAETTRAREAMAIELETARQAARLDKETFEAQHAASRERLDEQERRIASGVDRIKALELQQFQRERPLHNRDEDLSAMLERDLSAKPRRRASRYTFATAVGVDFGGEQGLLVDLSIAGAQVLSARGLEHGAEAKISLLSDEIPVSGKARVVWTRLDPNSHGRPLRYRAGILFTHIDAPAVEAFIIRYSTT
ncbi:MAG TPA: PilZ domain-containing protein [Vicinamibacterales bacterium]|jgi:chromosome segregation ATPase